MYNGNGETGEYIELTNLGTTAVDFTGWSFDDDSNNPGTVSLSAFGLVNPGESVILTEASAADFRSVWNLGRNVDEIGDSTIPGSIRAQNISGNPLSLEVLGTNNALGWIFASVGDVYGSLTSISTTWISATPAPSRSLRCRCRPPRGCYFRVSRVWSASAGVRSNGIRIKKTPASANPGGGRSKRCPSDQNRGTPWGAIQVVGSVDASAIRQ